MEDRSVADLIQWKNRRGVFLVLGSATLLWFLFVKCGYSFLPFVANTQLLLVVILFLWAKSAILFNRPMPQLPNLEITESGLTLRSQLLVKFTAAETQSNSFGLALCCGQYHFLAISLTSSLYSILALFSVC